MNPPTCVPASGIVKCEQAHVAQPYRRPIARLDLANAGLDGARCEEAAIRAKQIQEHLWQPTK